MGENDQQADRDGGRELPKIQEHGPEDHGWKMLTSASDRQVEALKQAMDERRVFTTDAELDDFMKEHE